MIHAVDSTASEYTLCSLCRTAFTVSRLLEWNESTRFGNTTSLIGLVRRGSLSRARAAAAWAEMMVDTVCGGSLGFKSGDLGESAGFWTCGDSEPDGEGSSSSLLWLVSLAAELPLELDMCGEDTSGPMPIGNGSWKRST